MTQEGLLSAPGPPFREQLVLPAIHPATMHTADGDTARTLETRCSSVEALSCGCSTRDHEQKPLTAAVGWQQNVSTTLAQLSRQVQEASQAVACIPPTSNQATSVLLDRLQSIEEEQKRLGREIQSLKEQLTEISERMPPPVATSSTDLEAKLKEQMELFKLDQERLHGRLQNALATKSLSPVKVLPMRNRKFPTNFPSTRGEFEHLTKERYEGLMSSYDIPISGDTAAKRDSLRAFLGIPAAPPERK